jgi:spheroidene monooxygenase
VYASLDFVRLPLGVAEWEAIRAGREGFAAEACFARRLFGVRLRSMPVVVPQFTRAGFFALWPDLTALERFRTGPLRRWQDADRRLSLTLRPVQGFGSWSGVDPLDGYRSEPDDGPVLLVTHSRTRLRSTPRFAWTDGPVVRALWRQPGRLWTDGFMDGIRTIDTGTLSLWRSIADATRFAYAPGVHQAAVKAEREGGWFTESWFARFAVIGAEGRWRGLDVPALAR